jgi:hypothetical protein
MSETASPVPAQKQSRRPLGCVTRAVITIAAIVAVVVAIGFAFDQGDSAVQPQHGFDAGPASAYQTPSVTAFEGEHLFLVRLADGSFTALYDRSTKQQELGGNCRLAYEESAGLGTLDPLPGLLGGFVEGCEGARAVWRADGRFAFGTSYGDLDRYAANVDVAGRVIVDTETRSCTRSAGVIGQEPYLRKTCGRGS